MGQSELDPMSESAGSERPLVSLVCCTTLEADLSALLHDVAANTSGQFEVVVVTQASASATAMQNVDGLINRLGLTGRAIEFGERNLSTARNVGVSLASGDWIGFPDDDCRYRPGQLDSIVAALRAATADVIFGQLEGSRQSHPRVLNDGDHVSAKGTANSNALFVRRSAMRERVGGFDPRLGTGQFLGAGEEIDWIRRALQAGLQVHFEPSIIVSHPIKGVGSRQRRSAYTRGYVGSRVFEGKGVLWLMAWSAARLIRRSDGQPRDRLPQVARDVLAGLHGGLFALVIRRRTAPKWTRTK